MKLSMMEVQGAMVRLSLVSLKIMVTILNLDT
jgi:hypothetical protein